MKQNQKGKFIDKEWTMPILAIVGSISFTIAIFILLGCYNNQPVFDWHGVTLNAMVSIMATISKALLAFTLNECLGQAKWIWLARQRQPLNDLNLIDQASRGPLGCCKILQRPIARSFISIGAITIILSTAMDPFFQITIGKKGDVIYGESSNARISYAKRYSKGSFSVVSLAMSEKSPIILSSSHPLTRQSVKADDGNSYLQTQADADFGMKSAVLAGLTRPDAYISQQNQHSCPSGNCTWDTFRSLAVCSACNDLTKQIVMKKMGFTVPLAIWLDTRNAGLFQKQVPEYRLPNGLTGDKTILMTAYGTGDSTESISFASLDTLIWSMTMMNFTGNHSISNDDPPINVSAIECGLWYCVNSYTPAIKNGNLTETVRRSPSKRNKSSWQPMRILNGEVFHTPPPNTINYDGISSSVRRSDLQLDQDFNISQVAVYGISKLLNDTFTVPSGGRKINAYALWGGDKNIYVPTVMQSLQSSPDLEATFASLAKSMTDNIRQNDDDGSVVMGKEGTYLLLIRVHFWFLTLPAFVIIVAAGFLVIVIHHTRTSDLEVWTTNALPVVALGRTIHLFDTEIDTNTEIMKTKTELMERKAKAELVQFGESNELLRRHSRKTSNSSDHHQQHGGYEQITN